MLNSSELCVLAKGVLQLSLFMQAIVLYNSLEVFDVVLSCLIVV